MRGGFTAQAVHEVRHDCPPNSLFDRLSPDAGKRTPKAGAKSACATTSA
jgi:hypothetical protein